MKMKLTLKMILGSFVEGKKSVIKTGVVRTNGLFKSKDFASHKEAFDWCEDMMQKKLRGGYHFPVAKDDISINSISTATAMSLMVRKH